MTESISSFVLSSPMENRMVPWAVWGVMPILVRTWEGSGEDVVQAEPVETQIPFKSRCSKMDSPSINGKLTLLVLEILGAFAPLI